MSCGQAQHTGGTVMVGRQVVCGAGRPPEPDSGDLDTRPRGRGHGWGGQPPPAHCDEGRAVGGTVFSHPRRWSRSGGWHMLWECKLIEIPA